MPGADWRTSLDDVTDPEWIEWHLLTPQERWRESQKLWETYLALGGSLDPDPDPQSPFCGPDEAVSERSLRLADVEVTRRWAASARVPRP